MSKELEKICSNCSCNKPYCGTCVYRHCKTDEDCQFVSQLCKDLRNKVITDKQFTIRYKKRFGVRDYE